jgi:membrane protease YdiL (CAAX protease family)
MLADKSQGWRRYSLWIYVTLAYLITWIVWLPVQSFATARGYILPDPTTLPALVKGGFQDLTHLLLAVTFVLISGPMVAAIIVLALESGREGLHGLWQRSTRWRVGVRWYLIMLGLVGAIYLPTVVLGAIQGPIAGPAQVFSALAWFAPLFIFEVLASGLEEPGWRGYALPNLQTRHSAKKSSLILGIIWGIWHWPVFIPIYNNVINTPGTSQAQAIITALVQLAIYIFGAMVAESLVYTWLYNRTESVFLCILFHTLHNPGATYVAIVLPGSARILPLLGGITVWIIAIVLMRFFWLEPRHAQSGAISAQTQVAGG